MAYTAPTFDTEAVNPSVTTAQLQTLADAVEDVLGTATAVTGSRGSNAALASLLTALAAKGIITDSTS